MAWTGGTFAANLKPTLRAVSITLALLFTLIATTPTAAQTGSPSGDRDALAAFYNATDGPNWAKNENWLSDEPLESWYGVETDDGGRVTEVRLGENRLNGRIPVELGRLSNLTVLHLDGNQLSGEIPPELGRLSNLTELRLWANQLTGEVPVELGHLPQLTVLGLSANRLSGEIPSGLGNCRT